MKSFLFLFANWKIVQRSKFIWFFFSTVFLIFQSNTISARERERVCVYKHFWSVFFSCVILTAIDKVWSEKHRPRINTCKGQKIEETKWTLIVQIQMLKKSFPDYLHRNRLQIEKKMKMIVSKLIPICFICDRKRREKNWSR